MSDQCKHCIYRGNIDFCRSVECYQHESWYAQQQISEIQSLKQELTEREWVSVEDRLPKEQPYRAELVLVASECGKVFEALYNTKVKKFMSRTHFEIFQNITHWQPLPPSPDIAKGE